MMKAGSTLCGYPNMSNPQEIEVTDAKEAAAIMSQYFRSYDLLALQAIKGDDSVHWDEMCGKRDAAYREYVRVTGLEGMPAIMAIIQPSGLV